MRFPRLESCPVCGYSLHRLPDRHRCPECGCEYDRDTEVFRQVDRTLIIEFALAVVFLLGAVLAAVVGAWSGQQLRLGWWDSMHCCFTVVWIVPALAGGWRLITGERNVVILSRTGITIIKPGSQPERVPWETVVAIRTSFADGSVQFVDRLGYKHPTFSAEFFGSKKRLRQFHQSAERWHQRAKQDEINSRPSAYGDGES